MRLNQKISYALACLFELAKWPMEFVDAEQIARARAIPPCYAQKILQCLANCGLVLSQKGRGYRLVRSLADITALEVIEALGQEDSDCADAAGRALTNKINETLRNVTLDHLTAA